MKFTTKSFPLNDKQYFNLRLGKRVLIKDLHNKKRVKIFGNIGLYPENNHKIPLYSSNPSEIYGYVEKSNISESSYPYVLWGIDGDFTFNIMQKDQKFATTDHCGTIKILNENILVEYVALQLDLKKQELGYDRTLRPSIELMEEHVEIDIPVDSSGNPDLNAQQILINKYKPIFDFQQKIKTMQLDIEKQQVVFDSRYEYVEESLSDLFIPKQGNAYYTKKRVLTNKWEGDIPIYSSNTEQEGLLLKIDLKHIKENDLYYQNCLTWTIDGIKAGTIFVRNHDNMKNEKRTKYCFTLNNHCGILIPKKQNLYLPFIKYVLQPIFYEKAKGYGKKKLGSNQIEDIFIKIPIDSKGNFDLQKQYKISEMYGEIEKSKAEIIGQLDLLVNQKVILS